MAGNGSEVARAYVTIIPKTDGSSGKVIKSIVDPLSKGGADAGTRAGREFSGKFSGLVGKAGKAAGLAVAAGVGVATAAMGGFAKSSLDVGRQFDSSMSQVAATMGKSVDEIGELRDFARDMGAKTAFSASQAAEGLNYMALAGYDAEKSMKMLPNVLNLAAAGGIDLAYASDMVTDAASALGLDMDQTTLLIDQMAKASSTTNTSVAQLGEALLTVGGTAKSMKGGTAEAAQALGLLADNGVKGSEGGTALRNVLLGLSSKKFEKTFGALGVSAYDAEGNMRSLKDVFADMNTAMADMTVEEKTNALSSAFNKVDLKSLNALLGTSAERWDEVADAIAGCEGAAAKMGETQLDNLEGDITKFGSALDEAKLSLSDSLTPALRDFVQFGTEGLGELAEVLKSDGFSSFAESFAEQMTGAAKGAYEFLFGVAAVFDEEGNDIVKERVPGMFDGIFDAVDFEGFAAAFQGLGDAIGAAFGDESGAASAKDVGTSIGEALNVAIPILEAATPVVGAIAGAIKLVSDNADVAVPVIGGIAGAFALFSGVVGVAGAVSTIAGALGAIGVTGGAAGAGMTAAAAGEAEMGAAAAGAGPSLLEVGAAILMIGGGVALAAAGVWLMADAAISLADAGAPAIGVMVGLAVGVVALGAAAAAGGSMMTAGAVGILAFGVAVLLVGAGVGLAAAGVALLAGQLPSISAFGASAAVASMALGAGLLVMGAGALVAGAGCIVLGAGLTAAAAGLLLVSPAMIAAAGGCAVLGLALGPIAGAVLDVGRGAADMGTGLQAAGEAMPAIADNALGAGLGIATLADAMAKASGDLSEGSSAMALAGSGATALATGVTVARGSAVQAASAFARMATAARGTVASVSASSAAAAAAAPAFSRFSSAASAGMSKAASSARTAASTIRSALKSIPTSQTVSLRFERGHIPTPRWSMTGKFDPKSGAVPNVRTWWAGKGGVFTQPTIIGVGDAREPEGVFPLSRLESLLDVGPGRGGDIHVDLNYTSDADANRMAVDVARDLKRLRMAGVF